MLRIQKINNDHRISEALVDHTHDQMVDLVAEAIIDENVYSVANEVFECITKEQSFLEAVDNSDIWEACHECGEDITDNGEEDCCPYCGAEPPEFEGDWQYHEIFQYIIISDQLFREIDAPRYEFDNVCFWGRTTFGQMFMADYCIQQIAKRVLADQYGWAK